MPVCLFVYLSENWKMKMSQTIMIGMFEKMVLKQTVQMECIIEKCFDQNMATAF